MARWQITIRGKGIRKASVEKLAATMLAEFGEDSSFSVTDATPPESRADRFQAAKDMVSEAKGEAEGLRDELQDWFDRLPENFQSGDKGSQLEDAISNLEEFIDNCDNVEGVDVDFPGMY